MAGPGMRFDRMELAGSLGDVGTLLPLGVGMIVINGLSASGLFFSVGAFYVLAGLYYRLPTPVQPMKVIGAYAVATGVSTGQIGAAGMLMAAMLLVVGLTGLMDKVHRAIPLGAVRGVQLSTGAVLMAQGLKLVAGTSKHQLEAGLAEPALAVQHLGPVPVGVALGVAFFGLTLYLLDSRRFPAGIVVVGGGLAAGLLLGGWRLLADVGIGLDMPRLLPFGMPSASDFAVAFTAMVLPQTPMTLGNAVVANADLARQYFGDDARRVTPRALCVSMGLANVGAALLGGMPLCHGAGGLAAHHRFGARTAGSNLIVGGLFLAGGVLFGVHATTLARCFPLAVLGVLLLFAGATLAMAVRDLRERKDLFTALLVLGVSLGSNLAWGFAAGIAVGHLLRLPRFNV